MQYFKLIATLFFLLAGMGASAETVTTGKIKHNGLDADGNLETIHQDVNRGAALVRTTDLKTSFGESLVGQLYPQFQGSFEYTVSNTDLNANTEVNGGTVTQASGMAVLTTSTTTASSALFKTKRHARYKSGLGSNLRFTALFTSPVADTEQYIGIMDETGSAQAFTNGYGIGFNGVNFGFHRWSNDTLTTVVQEDWDDPLDGTGLSGMTLDHTKLNVWVIRYQYLGAGKIQLMIEDDSTGLFVPIHTIPYANQHTEPSTHNPNYHFTIFTDNNSTISNIIIKSSSYGYFIEGRTSFIELHQPENSSGIIEKTGVTTEVAVLSIRNKSTYASKTNYIDIILISSGASVEASSTNNLADIRVIKNTTLGGVPSWSNINTTNSVVEIDTSGTTVTGGTDLDSSFLAGKNDRFSEDLITHRHILGPGESITISAESENSAIIRARIAWRELF